MRSKGIKGSYGTEFYGAIGILNQNYTTELLDYGCTQIISLGIGFTKRHVRVIEAE